MVLVSLLLMGVAVGLLAGMSLSPLVQTLVSSLIALCCTIIAAAAGLQFAWEKVEAQTGDAPKVEPRRRRARSIDPLPMALFMVGVTTGSLFGIRIRTSNWLGPDLGSILHKWSDGGAGLDRKLVVERVFDLEYPKSVPAEKGKEMKSGLENESKASPSQPQVAAQRVSGGLFTVETLLRSSECDALLATKDGATLRREALSLSDGPIKRAILRFKSNEDVSILMGEVCPSKP
jgi:hypothetical protein